MKRVISFILIAFTLFLIIKDGQAIAITNDHAQPKTEKLTFPKKIELIEEEKSYIPIWSFIDSIGAELISEPSSKSIQIKKDTSWIKFLMDENSVETSNDEEFHGQLIRKDEHLYIPTYETAKFFGYEVQFVTDSAKKEENKKVEYEMIPIINPKQETKKTTKQPKEVKVKEKVKEKVKTEISKPKVYLTFDDGPNEHIVPILDTLQEKKAKATFFMLEPLMRKYSKEVNRLVSEGHYPALHSVTHDKDKLYFGNPLNVAKEMEKTRQTLLEITGVDSKLTRVPYGSKPFMKDALRDGLVENDFLMWDWNLDTVDWRYQNSNPNMILQNVKEGVGKLRKSGEPIVVLMHVNKGTASVLPKIIDYLHAQGYECAAYNPNNHFMMNFWNDERL